MKKVIFTLGYTMFDHNIDGMFELLKKLGVTHLIDVRSVPRSRFYPEYNPNSLQEAGKRHGLPYMWMSEIGAKSSSEEDVFSPAKVILDEDIFPIAKTKRPEKTPLAADEQIVDFEMKIHSPLFVSGLQRIESAYEKGFTLALMCSEKNPIDCHRYFLISRALDELYGEWLEVRHIVSDNTGSLTLVNNDTVKGMLKNDVLSRCEVKKIMARGGIIDVDDFCMRYWNILHGWKSI